VKCSRRSAPGLPGRSPGVQTAERTRPPSIQDRRNGSRATSGWEVCSIYVMTCRAFSMRLSKNTALIAANRHHPPDGNPTAPLATRPTTRIFEFLQPGLLASGAALPRDGGRRRGRCRPSASTGWRGRSQTAARHPYGYCGATPSTQTAPRRFEADGRPGAEIALVKQRTFRPPVSRGVRAHGDGAGSGGAVSIGTGARPTPPPGGAGPALPRLRNLTSGPDGGLGMREQHLNREVGGVGIERVTSSPQTR
jgi:hypothetical protein